MKDKGFELFYYNLSNRRKFIRTLWLFPFMVLAAALVHWRFSNVITTIVVSIVMLAVWIGQAVVTYRNWKKEEEGNTK